MISDPAKIYWIDENLFVILLNYSCCLSNIWSDLENILSYQVNMAWTVSSKLLYGGDTLRNIVLLGLYISLF